MGSDLYGWNDRERYAEAAAARAEASVKMAKMRWLARMALERANELGDAEAREVYVQACHEIVGIE